LGRMTWQQLEGLGVLAQRWADGKLRVTHEQGIAVVNIPTSAKNAALTDAAALGLSIHADALDRNTMACTGSQFCNIAVTETKGQMFHLLEKLRKRAVRLESIRIHMSGCPSSCAQHFTADIGLKGVRVRRLFGTREGFDVFLGGGIGGGIQMARTFRLGVDVDQLPSLIEEVVSQYYLHHQPGQTFSDYWRTKLPEDCSDKAGDADYRPPVWLCEKCDHRHLGVDPPVFCPNCAGLRRHFVRLDAHQAEQSKNAVSDQNATPPRSDGFLFAADEAALPAEAGLEVEVAGKSLALFRAANSVHAIDAFCPHEGAPLAQGELREGVVTCPWHGWTFDACTGCSLAPVNNNLAHYETLVEDGKVFVKFQPEKAVYKSERPIKRAVKAVDATLRLVAVCDEAPDVRTFRFDNSAGHIPFDYPGKFLRICVPVDGQEIWRSFTISSSPAKPSSLDLTIKRNPGGVVSQYLFDHARPGGQFKLRGSQGGFFFDPAQHSQPLVLVSAGSGITPMISIARYLRDRGLTTPCTFLHGARTVADILFARECQMLAESLPDFRYHVTLSRPDATWSGTCGRLDIAWVVSSVSEPAACRYFLCGPDDFMTRLAAGLADAGVPANRVHTEQFHAGALSTA